MDNCKRIIAVAIASLSLGVSSLAVATPERVSASEVPRAVAAAISERYPNAQGLQFVREMGHGRTVYAVKLAVAGARAQLCVAASGGIEREQQAIAPAALPAAVQRSLAASGFKSADVVAAQRVTRAAQPALPTFELVVAFEGTEHQLTFTAEGELVTAPVSGSCIAEPGVKSDRVARAAPRAASASRQSPA